MGKAEERPEREEKEIIKELEECHKERRRRIFFGVFAIMIFVVIGMAFYSFNEGWSLVDSFYFSAVTLTTVGYGDIHPTNDVSKIFTAFYVLLGVGTILYLLTTIASYIVEEREQEFYGRIRGLRKMGIRQKAGYVSRHIIKKVGYSRKDFRRK